MSPTQHICGCEDETQHLCAVNTINSTPVLKELHSRCAVSHWMNAS